MVADRTHKSHVSNQCPFLLQIRGFRCGCEIRICKQTWFRAAGRRLLNSRYYITVASPPPAVDPNSLRGVKDGASAVFTWTSSDPGTGEWSIHRTDVDTELPDLWLDPALAALTAETHTDPTPPPGLAEPWFYRVFGVDCVGTAQP